MRILMLLSFCVLFSFQSFATQTLKIKPFETLHAKIGFNELNRIVLKEGRISDVISKGQAQFQFDEEAGQIFVQPTQKGTLALSLKTESGQYQDLHLTVLEIPSQVIVLTGGEAKVEEAVIQFEKERSYVDMVTQLIKAMASGENSYGWAVSKKIQPIQKWSDMDLKRIQFFKGHRFDGEVLKITNDSQDSKYLTEKNFFDSNAVVAIGLSEKMLLPNQTGYIYRVLRNDKF